MPGAGSPSSLRARGHRPDGGLGGGRDALVAVGGGGRSRADRVLRARRGGDAGGVGRVRRAGGAAPARRRGGRRCRGRCRPGAPADGYLPLIRVARTAFDSREEGIAARPAVVKLNAEEAELVTGTAADALDAARTLHEAVRRRGDRDPRPRGGGHGGAGRERRWRRVADAEGRYPVGSGDAFLAGSGGGARRRRRLGRCAARGDRRRGGQRRAARGGSARPRARAGDRGRGAARRPPADTSRDRHGPETSQSSAADPLHRNDSARSVTAAPRPVTTARVGLRPLYQSDRLNHAERPVTAHHGSVTTHQRRPMRGLTPPRRAEASRQASRRP